MGRKSKNKNKVQPFCFYCDREFDDEKVCALCSTAHFVQWLAATRAGQPPPPHTHTHTHTRNGAPLHSLHA